MSEIIISSTRKNQKHNRPLAVADPTCTPVHLFIAHAHTSPRPVICRQTSARLACSRFGPGPSPRLQVAVEELAARRQAWFALVG